MESLKWTSPRFSNWKAPTECEHKWRCTLKMSTPLLLQFHAISHSGRLFAKYCRQDPWKKQQRSPFERLVRTSRENPFTLFWGATSIGTGEQFHEKELSLHRTHQKKNTKIKQESLSLSPTVNRSRTFFWDWSCIFLYLWTSPSSSSGIVHSLVYKTSNAKLSPLLSGRDCPQNHVTDVYFNQGI